VGLSLCVIYASGYGELLCCRILTESYYAGSQEGKNCFIDNWENSLGCRKVRQSTPEFFVALGLFRAA